ncbi:MAG: nucleotidyl transferase, partial [Chloroflexi bacterium]|nr:nucleotidyl transferase [Chloroflexota bacterium]
LGRRTVSRNDGQWDTSNVEFTAGQILAYDKAARTPRMQHIDYGLGVFDRAAFENLPAGVPIDLAVVYQDLLRQGRLAAFEVRQRFYEIGSWQGIAELERHLAQQAGAKE